VIDRRKIGLGVLAFVRVKIDTTARPRPAPSKRRAEARCVIACYSIAGDADFLLQVVAHDLDDYADFAMNVVRGCRDQGNQTTFVLKR